MFGNGTWIVVSGFAFPQVDVLTTKKYMENMTRPDSRQFV